MKKFLYILLAVVLVATVAYAGVRVQKDHMKYTGDHVVLNSRTLTADTTLTQRDCGKTIFFGTAGVDVTLPNDDNTGCILRFVQTALIATTSMTVQTLSDANTIQGTLMVIDADGDFDLVACANEDAVNFVHDADTAGNYLQLQTNGTNWYITDSLAAAVGGLTCTT